MHPDEWHARQTRAQQLAAQYGLDTSATDELEALAAALRADNPALSDDQALDAAIMMDTELADFAAAWERDRAAAWTDLMQLVRDWDQRCAAHYALQLPPD